MSGGTAQRPYSDNLEHLKDELRRLDLLIRLRAVSMALHNAVPEAQAARTVYITGEEVEWLLAQDGVPVADDVEAAEVRAALARISSEIAARVSRSLEAGVVLALPRLAQLFGLSAFELQTIVICLAPELRRKYDRLYAYLQDDITRKRPSVDLVVALFCKTEDERWRARGVFAETAPLLRGGLLRKVDDPHSPSGSSGLAQFLELDPRIHQFLLGSNHLDARLVGQARLDRPVVPQAEPTMAVGSTTSVLSLVDHHLAAGNADGRRLVLYLHGPSGIGKRDLALHTCRHLGISLLSIDAEALLAQGPDADSLLHLAFREGLIQQAALYLERADALLQDAARPLLKSLAMAIEEYGWLVLLSGKAPWTAGDAFAGFLFQPVALPVPDVPLRQTVWQRSLAGHTAEAEGWAVQLAARFRLTPGQIRAAVEVADNRRLMAPERGPLTLGDVSAACRQQSNQKLGELAVKIEPRFGWDDIILPEDKVAHLRELCSQVRHHYLVFGHWGFGRKLRRGKGVSALFSGRPGTGKTMAAEVVAHDLGLDLYKVDLSGVVSKYIGETEKNLAHLFEEAETSNAILFFDEADALFGKRTEVSDAHDRYANIETSYLLQKMEEHEGIVILATNLRENMDDAFTRRIRFIIEFPFPEVADRLRIWQTLFAAEVPVSSGIDYGYLAREFAVAGGNIKNIAVNAAFLAAANGRVIEMEHLRHAARREFEKIGKLWTDRPEA